MADPEQELVEQSVRDTEDELMKTAFEPTPKQEPAEPPPKKDRPRDLETGRFTKAAPAAEQPAEPAPAPEEPAKSKEEEEILPSWRAREINEERRQAHAELERMRVEHARLQAYVAQQQREQKPQEPQTAPDPMLDPVAYDKYRDQREQRLLQYMEEQRAMDRLNNNLEMTHMRYGDGFEKAYEALVAEGQRGNAMLVRHLTSQNNPGDAIMRWHQRESLLRDTGGDLDAYNKKQREALLNDPAFRTEAEQHWRNQALGNSGQPKPNTVVKMPPSLSKATGTAEVPQTATDGSEAALFNFAMTSKRR